MSDWQEVYRPKYLELRGLDDTPYLFPGKAQPPRGKAKVVPPAGCMSASSRAALWKLGDQYLGLGLTPHQCRHAVATLTLAIHPGNFALVASILGNTEDVARQHYGRDSGEAAAGKVREALLAHHPDIFSKLKRKK